mmetsp:Transcript_46731/g.116478  ORF Transcript_46731/g.116478 Transcript_46731/m.116478 type:complete len:268 (-) Transcript_46731:129-932(-)
MRLVFDGLSLLLDVLRTPLPVLAIVGVVLTLHRHSADADLTSIGRRSSSGAAPSASVMAPFHRYGLSLDADAINLAGGEAALLGREIHKRHSTRLLRLPVLENVDVFDLTGNLEGVVQVVLGGILGQVVKQQTLQPVRFGSFWSATVWVGDAQLSAVEDCPAELESSLGARQVCECDEGEAPLPFLGDVKLLDPAASTEGLAQLFLCHTGRQIAHVHFAATHIASLGGFSKLADCLLCLPLVAGLRSPLSGRLILVGFRVVIDGLLR